MNGFDALLKGAMVITPDGPVWQTVAVKDGKIDCLLAPDAVAQAQQVYDFSGKVILPGAVDTHGHIANKEPFEYGTAMAARGGFSTVIEMPMSKFMPNNDCIDVFKERQEQIRQEAYVDVALLCAAYPHTLDRMEELLSAGCAGFKVFTCPAGKNYPHFDAYGLRKLFAQAAQTGALIAIHAENQSICDGLTKDAVEAGQGPEGFEPSRPAVAEALAVATACMLAKEAGARIHICHVTCPEAMEVIVQARKAGVDVTAETCAQYLSLTSEDIVRCGTYAKCGPPLRSAERVEALWQYVLSGEMDTIGTDGTVYTPAEKDQPFWQAASGFPGMDIVLPTLVHEGVHKRGLDWTVLARLIATKAAQRFGLENKGRIAPGCDADFAVIDPEALFTFRAEETFWKVKTSRFAYEGKTYRGKVEATFVRGKPVYLSGKLTGQKGYGCFQAPAGKGGQTDEH